MICECGRNISARGLARHLQGKEHHELVERRRKDAEQRMNYRNYMIFSALEAGWLVELPEQLRTAALREGAWDKNSGTLRVIDDFYLDRGVDVIEYIHALDFEIPATLDPRERLAAQTIVDVLKSDDALHSGGARVFYTPQEWEVKERFPFGGSFVVVHDDVHAAVTIGGSHAAYFNYDYEQPELIQRMQDALKSVGFYTEQMSSWASGVYPL